LAGTPLGEKGGRLPRDIQGGSSWLRRRISPPFFAASALSAQWPPTAKTAITETAFSPGPRTDRLVASELERRWNAALAVVETLEKDLDAMVRQRPAALSAEEHQCLLQLGADLEAAWHHPAATAAKRKRIIRAVVGDPADSGCEGSPDRNRTEALREAHCPDFERTPKHSRRNLERRTRRPSGSAYPSSAGTCDEVAARSFFSIGRRECILQIELSCGP